MVEERLEKEETEKEETIHRIMQSNKYHMSTYLLLMYWPLSHASIHFNLHEYAEGTLRCRGTRFTTAITAIAESHRAHSPFSF